MRSPTGWPRLGAAAIILLAAVFAYAIARMPLQVTDALVPILQSQQASSVGDVFRAAAVSAGYLRPLRMTEIKLLTDLAAGQHEVLVFKTLHVVLLLGTALLFARLAVPRSARDLAALSFALTVFFGLHTTLGLLWEAYPINHFLQIVLLCLAALALTRARGGALVDAAALAVLATALLTLESGLLVFVVVVVAWLVGWRGVSRAALAACALMVVAYFAWRHMHVGAPALLERASGFGFARLSPEELVARFGRDPRPFYAYNVACATLGLLFSEPRGGTWGFVRQASAHALQPWMLVHLGSSIVATGVIGGFVAARARHRRPLDDDGRMVIVAAAVVAANAALSYAYAKDEIMSVAGAFYALAVYAALRRLLADAPRHAIASGTLAAVLAVGSTGWALRTAGTFYKMRQQADIQRREWVVVDAWLAAQLPAPLTATQQATVHRLRAAALNTPTPAPFFTSPRLARVLESGY